jgi:hypothetical protein
MDEWIYRSKCTWPRYWLEMSGQPHALVVLSAGNSPVLIGYEDGSAPEPVWTTWKSESC